MIQQIQTYQHLQILSILKMNREKSQEQERVETITAVTTAMKFDDLIKIKDPYVETDCDLLGRFESIYPCKLWYEGKVVMMFYDPIIMDFATEDPVVMHDKVYEKSIITSIITGRRP